MEGFALIKVEKGYGEVLGPKILNIAGIQRVHITTSPFAYIAEFEVGNNLHKLESAVQDLRKIRGVVAITVCFTVRTLER